MSAALRLSSVAPASRCRTINRSSRVVKTFAFAVPDSYGYVLGSVASTALMTQWLAVKVAYARRQYGVTYPAMYAEGNSEEANMFNCIQRSHQNTLEYLPNVLALQLAMGLRFPVTAAALGLAWAVGRVLYAQGYSTGDPAKRGPGSAIAGVVYLALIGGTLFAGYRMMF